MRNRPNFEPIDVVDLIIHALAGSMKIEHYPFRAEFNPLQNPNTATGNNRALNRTCFHDFTGSIGTTKRQPNPAMRWAILWERSHRLTDTIVNSRSHESN
jgi:hypothetical protein